MNILLIIVVAILIGCMITGYRKGFLRIVYSLIAWILVMAFVYISTPYIKEFIIENTGIDESIEAYCEETVRKPIETQVQKDTAQTVGTTAEELKAAGIEELGIKLPESVIEDIIENTSNTANDFLEESGAYTKLSQAMADFMLQGIAFMVAFVIGGAASVIISCVLGIVSKIPVLSGTNKTLGLLAGAIEGLLIVWTAFYFIAIFSSSEAGGILVSYIYDSAVLTFLYENNLVLTIINIF